MAIVSYDLNYKVRSYSVEVNHPLALVSIEQLAAVYSSERKDVEIIIEVFGNMR